jgi:phage terminase large subunit
MAIVKLSKLIGKGYREFWRCTKRYRVVKGGRGSKKSTTTALNIIYRMMKYPNTNTLVIRKTFASHKDSTYSQLKWAITQLKVNHLWEYTKSPLEITYKPTGQKILFRGLDDPLKITSITVDVGYLCWCWFEEAYEVTNEDDFNKIDLSIRGKLPLGLFKQITLSFNPWNEKHWLKRRFFDIKDDDVFALTTNYKCNEFLGPDDISTFEKMKKNSPRRYAIEGLGNWGIAEGMIYDNWEEKEFDYRKIAKQEGIISTIGLDFGYVSDPTALICSLVDKKNRIIYIYDEHYQKSMLNNEIANMIKYKGYSKEQIIADSAEQKSIEEIRIAGISRIKPARKGKDSIINGIQYLLQYKIYVHPKCSNTQVEFLNYVWDKNKEGQQLNKPVDEYNHLLDALRYSMEPLQIEKRIRVTRC